MSGVTYTGCWFIRTEVFFRNRVLISSVCDGCKIDSLVFGGLGWGYIQFMTIQGTGFFREMNFLLMC